MKKADKDMKDRYLRADFKTLERGKFFEEVRKGSAVALLDPEVAKAFPTSQAVNEALLGLLALTETTARLTSRGKKRPRKRTAA